jgi:hypothetical protein
MNPAWQVAKRAPKGAPNVLFIVLDDTGLDQLGCYGSPIATPNLDRLAATGLRYDNMHTTALCFAEPVLHHHRPQPPRQRDGLHHRDGNGLSRRWRPRPVRERLSLGELRTTIASR